MSTVLDKYAVPEVFTTFPARIHNGDEEVAKASQEVLDRFRDLIPNIDDHHIATGPYGHCVAICFPDGELERVKASAQIIAFIWIYDDFSETLPQEEANRRNSALKATLRNPTAPPAEGDEIGPILVEIASKIVSVDPKDGPSVLKDLQYYIVSYDPAQDYHNLETYLQYRTVNIGMQMLICLMKWCWDIKLEEDDHKALQAYYDAATLVVILTNDYFSWDLDKRTSKGARIPNIVPVMMEEFKLSEQEVRVHLKGMIVDAEQKTRRLGNKLKKESESQNVLRYVKAMELFIGGGNGFWSASCPRYNDPSAAW